MHPKTDIMQMHTKQKADSKGAYHYDKPKQPIWTDKYCIFKNF